MKEVGTSEVVIWSIVEYVSSLGRELYGCSFVNMRNGAKKIVGICQMNMCIWHQKRKVRIVIIA